MLHQLHKQNSFPPYESEGMIAQGDFTTQEALSAWFNNVSSRNSLTDRQQWVLVMEGSEMFELEVST